MSPPPVTFVYFDVDDTLLDTTAAVTAAVTAGARLVAPALAEAGVARPPADVEYRLLGTVGSNLPEEFFQAWLLEAGAGDRAARDLAGPAAAAYRAHLECVPAFPATVATLRWLADHGLRLGVITDGRAERQLEKLARAGLASFFGPVFVSEEYPMFQGKPAQAMYRDALAAAGCPPEKVLAVGDRDQDIIGANLAGMVSVRVLQGWANRRPTPAPFRAAESAYVIRDLGELPAVVARRNGGS